jgi:hypothetical protein
MFLLLELFGTKLRTEQKEEKLSSKLMLDCSNITKEGRMKGRTYMKEWRRRREC